MLCEREILKLKFSNYGFDVEERERGFLRFEAPIWKHGVSF